MGGKDCSSSGSSGSSSSSSGKKRDAKHKSRRSKSSSSSTSSRHRAGKRKRNASDKKQSRSQSGNRRKQRRSTESQRSRKPEQKAGNHEECDEAPKERKAAHQVGDEPKSFAALFEEALQSSNQSLQEKPSGISNIGGGVAGPVVDAQIANLGTGDASEKLEKVEDLEKVAQFEDLDPDEPVEKKLQRDISSLREMLDERVRQQLDAKDDAQVLDIEADIDILRGLVREKEAELAKEIARLKEQEILDEREKLKQSLLEREMQKQKEEEERLVQRRRQHEAELREREFERERQMEAEKRRREMEALEPHTLPPPEADPPCELPIWCVMPRRQDIVNDVELVRLSSSSRSLLKIVWLGRRSWALFGRRDVDGPKPDIGLATARASRSHAVILRNWLGQVYLLDLGSPNGTFLDKQKLKPHTAIEWKIGSTVYFADASLEVFELRLWKKG